MFCTSFLGVMVLIINGKSGQMIGVVRRRIERREAGANRQGLGWVGAHRDQGAAPVVGFCQAREGQRFRSR